MKKIKMPSIIKNTIGQYISNNLKEYINESKFIYHCISFAFDSL